MFLEPLAHVVERQSLEATRHRRPSANGASRNTSDTPQSDVPCENPEGTSGDSRPEPDSPFANQEARADTRQVFGYESPRHQCKEQHSCPSRDGRCGQELRTAHSARRADIDDGSTDRQRVFTLHTHANLWPAAPLVPMKMRLAVAATRLAPGRPSAGRAVGEALRPAHRRAMTM